jgi:hypothetical protein
LTTETQQALAVLFRRFNEEPVPRDDLVKALSLELDWTKPSRAENLLDRGLNAGHVESHDDGLAPTFATDEVDVPFGFAPAEEVFEPVETEEDTGDENGEATPRLDRLLDRLAEVIEGERNKAVAAANAQQDDMAGLVTIETAALLVAHGKGLDVEEETEQVLAGLRA